MKKSKIGRLAALLAASSLLFAGFFTSCKSDDDEGGGGSNSSDVTNDDSGVTVPVVSIDGFYSPATGATAFYEDGSLIIKFDSTPTVDRSTDDRAVKVYSADGTLVDSIKSFDENVSSNAKNASYQTVNVKKQLISVSGTSVVIKLHSSLANDTSYYVNIDEGLFTGKVNGVDFSGISDSSTWTFTTRSAPSISGNEITVGSDKNFSTIQGALNYIKNSSDSWTITVDEGFYHELLTYSGDAKLTLVGSQSDFDAQSGDDGKVVVYWANANLWNGSSRQRMMFLWEGSDLTIKNMTFANVIDRADVGTSGTQAETLYFDSTANLIAYNSSFKSHQDTLLIGNNGGRGWFYQCYIEGDTDYIWGYPAVVLFEECTLRCLYDSAATTHTSYIFASRTPTSSLSANKGLVLFNSTVKVDNGVTAYYGRNSGSDTQAAVVFNIFEKVDSKLWYEGSTKYDEDIEGICSVGYKDYGNVYEDGSEISTDSRVEGAYGLSKVVAEREYCGRNAILNRGWDATNRKYVPASTQWDISAFETEFNASEDKSKSMIYLEPTYIAYLEGNASSDAFTATNYAGTAVDSVSYAVSDETLATVADGVVTAKESVEGTVTLTVTSNSMSGVATINVIKQIVEATSLTLNKTEAFSINKDDEVTLSVTFAPEDVTDSEVIWSSSNTDVLRVTGSGSLGTGTSATVSGFGVGSATITATSKKTPTVYTSVDITVEDVYCVNYLSESSTYTKNASVAHRDQSVVANPVSYGFAGDVAVKATSADILWGNNGWPFASEDTVSNAAGADFAWADFTIKAAADITLDAITASAYCSATSNERAIVYVKVGDGEFTQMGEVAADNKAMQFTKQDITTTVNAGTIAVVRVAIASTEGKTVSKEITGVIGGVSIYYTITGTPITFAGADGEYNIIDYYSGSGTQWDSIEDGSSADGMVSWESLKYHSANYGAAVSGSGNTGTVKIKVGGASVISIVGSQYGNGTLTVTNSTSEVIAGPASTKMSSDGSVTTRTLSFLYTDSTEDTLSLVFTGTSYIGTITVKELTTEVAEVTSVTVNGTDTVSTASPSTFTATVETTYCASTAVEWTSSDENVATVDENGTVTGVAAGTATITATSTVDSTKSDSIEITVIEEELKPVTGTTYSYNFKDSSSSDYVAVTAKTAGSSPDSFVSWNEYWSTHSYGLQSSDKTQTAISIKVAGNVLVGFTGYNAADGVMTVTDASDNVVLEKMPMATGSDATTKWFIYKGDETTLTLTQLSGTTYISTLTVKPWTNEVAAVTNVTLSGAGSVAVGNSIELSAKVTTDYFADESLTWSSGDDTIATVVDGVVTGVSAGDVTITATSVNNPEISGTKTIKVTSGEATPIYGYTYSYTLTGNVGTPYTSSDSFLVVTANSDNGGHGLIMKDGNTIVLKVAGAGTVTLGTCAYDKACTITVTNSSGEQVGNSIAISAGDEKTDNTTVDFAYDGEADTLTFTYSAGTGGQYLHSVKFTPSETSTTYTLTGKVGTPYTSDDGNLVVTANSDNGGHGLVMKDGNTIVLKVAGVGTVTLGTCAYDNACTITVTDSSGELVGESIAISAGDSKTDNTTVDFAYDGEADTLTFTYSAGTGGQYLHSVKIAY